IHDFDIGVSVQVPLEELLKETRSYVRRPARGEGHDHLDTLSGEGGLCARLPRKQLQAERREPDDSGVPPERLGHRFLRCCRCCLLGRVITTRSRPSRNTVMGGPFAILLQAFAVATEEMEMFG